MPSSEDCFVVSFGSRAWLNSSPRVLFDPSVNMKGNSKHTPCVLTPLSQNPAMFGFLVSNATSATCWKGCWCCCWLIVLCHLGGPCAFLHFTRSNTAILIAVLALGQMHQESELVRAFSCIFRHVHLFVSSVMPTKCRLNMVFIMVLTLYGAFPVPNAL